MEKKRMEELIEQYQFMEQEILTEEQKRIFRIAYKMGTQDKANRIGEKPPIENRPQGYVVTENFSKYKGE